MNTYTAAMGQYRKAQAMPDQYFGIAFFLVTINQVCRNLLVLHQELYLK